MRGVQTVRSSTVTTFSLWLPYQIVRVINSRMRSLYLVKVRLQILLRKSSIAFCVCTAYFLSTSSAIRACITFLIASAKSAARSAILSSVTSCVVSGCRPDIHHKFMSSYERMAVNQLCSNYIKGK